MTAATDYGVGDLREAAASAGRRAPGVSRWSVGMHVHHCCLAMTGICRTLEGCASPPPTTRGSLVSWLVFTSGWIPRGRATSPTAVVPRDTVTHDELVVLLDESERALRDTAGLDPQSWFEHFAFGVLTRDKALRFIRIHNRHHLKIIADILTAG